MSDRDSILAALHGLRLALYDELHAAGPAGLRGQELRDRTAADRNRLGAEGQHSDALDWLINTGLVHEYQPARFRVIPRDEWQPGAENPARDARNSLATRELARHAIDHDERPSTKRTGGQLKFF